MEKLLLTFIIIMCSLVNVYSQDISKPSQKEKVDHSTVQSTQDLNKVNNSIDYNQIFTASELHQKPQFPDGDAALYKYLYDELRYPADAKKASISGKVIISFIVYEDGEVEDVKVVRGISPSCDAEAIRLVKMMPTWTPGTINGKPVKVKYTLPITFKL